MKRDRMVSPITLLNNLFAGITSGRTRYPDGLQLLESEG